MWWYCVKHYAHWSSRGRFTFIFGVEYQLQLLSSMIDKQSFSPRKKERKDTYFNEVIILRLMLTNQEISHNIFCLFFWCVCECDMCMFCVWFSRCVRLIHETCMFPSQQVSPSLWGVPSSEAKDVFLYSHTSTKKRRYCNKL